MEDYRSIVSIKYDIHKGEYSIKERDPITGRIYRTFANRLNATEINFATMATRHESELYIIWTK